MAFAVQPTHAGHRQHHAGLRVLALARERFAAGQHQMHTRGADAVYRTDGADDLALERARLVDLLLELGCGDAVGTIEDLVADGATGRQAFAGKRQPRIRHLRGGHQDLAAVACDAIRDMAASELLHDL